MIITDEMVERGARAYVRAIQEAFEDSELINFTSKDWIKFENDTWKEQAPLMRAALEAALS